MKLTRERIEEIKNLSINVGRAEIEDALDDLIAHAEATIDFPSVVGREWVRCPICGEVDMSKTPDGEDGFIVNCVNLACGSNGGENFSAINDRHPHFVDTIKAEIEREKGIPSRGEIAMHLLCSMSFSAMENEEWAMRARDAVDGAGALLAELRKRKATQ